MPPNLLDQQLASVRRRIRQALLTSGASWVAVVVTGALLTACLGDWLFHFDDPIVRLILGLAIAGGAAWVIGRRLVAPLRRTLSDVDLALCIEERFPGFRDGLASSVQFARSGADPRIGSPELQQVVIASTLGRLKGIDCTDVVNTRQVRRVAAIAAGVCVATLALAAWNHESTAIALQRLAMPFSGPAWPRQTHLRFLTEDLTPLVFDEHDSLRIARGTALTVLVENASGRLPARVVLEYRALDAKTASEVLRPTTKDQSSGKRLEVAVGQLPTGRGDVEFRAVGGYDDQMPWRRLEVVPPPAIERLQVTVTPPAYTGRSPEILPEGVGHIQGLVGSHIEIVAYATQPIETASLRVRDQQARPVSVSDGARRLDASFVIGDPGVLSWWFDLADTSGFQNPDPPHYEVRGIEDEEPEIFIELPAADGQATAEAVVRVRTTARDDLGLKELQLVYRLEPADNDEEQTIPLFQRAPAASAGRQASDAEPVLAQTVEYLWKIADLAPAPGTRIVFRTEATDHFDLAPECPDGQAPPLHVGKSVMRVLTIASREEKSQEIAQRQEGLLSDLDRAHKLEQQARQQVDDLVLQLKNVDGVRPEDLDSLQRTELGQRDVAAQLASPANGLARRAAELLDELRNNQLNEPQTERRLKSLADELERLDRDHLRSIEQDLTQARKQLQSGGKEAAKKKPADAPNQPAPREQRPADALEQVSQNQAAVVESLGEMLHDLSQWRGEHDAAAELADIVRQQNELNQRAAELSKKTLTRPADELPPQDRADLVKTAERQKKQADQLDQVESRMRATHQALSNDDPSAAAVLHDAADQVQQQGIAGRMREAADQIGENRMGQAARTQQDVLQKLRELEDLLRHNGESDSEMLVKKLKAAEQELADLHDRQAELLRKLQEAGQNGDAPTRQEQLEALRKEQARVQEETARMARRLARLEARRAGTSAERAAAQMRAAQGQLAGDDSSGAADHQQEAVDDLEQARRELAGQRREAEETLAREQIAKIADELAGLVPRQQAALDETRRLDELHTTSGKWTRAQLVTLRDVAKVQRGLAEETGRIVSRVAAAEVFALALKGAVRSMEQAAGQLDERETGKGAQQPQQAALRRLADLLEALKPEQRDPQQAQGDGQDQQGGSGAVQDGPQSDGIPSLAQLKLLITMQKELLTRTAELERLRGADGLLPQAARNELEAIVREQGELADLFLSVAARTATDAENRDEPQTDEKSKAE
ncbi:MAG: hypothetical protein HY290_21455 [Planctomycetia bacterium]|nr:hypothetical protein [Planctomycetia bacterium]